MDRISEITKRDICELFTEGFNIINLFEMEKIIYPYFGRMNEIEFLNRLYDLKSIPSIDVRYPDSESEILQHTIMNDDYPACWVFEDDRFNLKNGSDEEYLRFICEIFNPVVRDEKRCWKELLTEINKLLKYDGYEIYPAAKKSNRDIYNWRIIESVENGVFIPYSQRNKKLIQNKKIKIKINRSTRKQIYTILEKYNNVNRITDETGWNYDVITSKQVLDDISLFYTPMCFNNNQYVETNSIEDIISTSSPYCVLDTIEFFEKYNINTDFEVRINTMFKMNGLNLKLEFGKIVNLFDKQITSSPLSLVQETGLKELLQESTLYYDEGNYKNAVEKLWDAFERLKTYYSPTLDKKKSINKIIEDMSGQRECYKELFEKEFSELTNIGNRFRIRHHETTKFDIDDMRHYDYFYKRCLSLISVTINYLEGKNVL